jgi:3-methyladenine DNA glycosylase AlkD
MARQLSDWGSIDLFGVTVAGKAWREGILEDDTIRSWTKSPNRWMRRLALVATVPLNSKSRGGEGDAVRTLDICGRLLSDRDDMVVKALSWALRELAKRDPAPVRVFLATESHRLAALVRREVLNKLTYGTKAIPRRA